MKESAERKRRGNSRLFFKSNSRKIKSSVINRKELDCKPRLRSRRDRQSCKKKQH